METPGNMGIVATFSSIPHRVGNSKISMKKKVAAWKNID